MNFAIIVASARVRSGKTLLARLLAENFILAGARPAIFDTDPAAAALSSRFPADSIALDLDRVTDQMVLFDELAAEAANSRIVDLSHQSFRKFFDLMLDSEFVREARANEVEPVVFYIPGSDLESFQQARLLRDRLGDCPLVLVENAHLGEIRLSIQHSEDYRSLAHSPLRMVIPALEAPYMSLLEEPGMSISEFVRASTVRMAPDMRNEIRSWLVKTLGEIYRVLQLLARRAPDPGLLSPYR